MAPGCLPGVSVEWVDGPATFGRAGPGIWLDIRQTFSDGKVEREHQFLASDGAGDCTDWQEYWDANVTLRRTLYQASKSKLSPRDLEDVCEQVKAGLSEQEQAVANIQFDHGLNLDVSWASDDDSIPAPDGSYVSRAEANSYLPFFTGQMQVGGILDFGNPLADVDCATEDWFGMLKGTLYAGKDELETFFVAAGTLTLTASGPDAYDLDLVDATLEATGGEAAGQMSVSGRFERCELNLELSKY